MTVSYTPITNYKKTLCNWNVMFILDLDKKYHMHRQSSQLAVHLTICSRWRFLTHALTLLSAITSRLDSPSTHWTAVLSTHCVLSLLFTIYITLQYVRDFIQSTNVQRSDFSIVVLYSLRGLLPLNQSVCFNFSIRGWWRVFDRHT